VRLLSFLHQESLVVRLEFVYFSLEIVFASVQRGAQAHYTMIILIKLPLTFFLLSLLAELILKFSDPQLKRHIFFTDHVSLISSVSVLSFQLAHI
jgi:hypothetical protein